jgi:hypothetical protein
MTAMLKSLILSLPFLGGQGSSSYPGGLFKHTLRNAGTKTVLARRVDSLHRRVTQLR